MIKPVAGFDAELENSQGSGEPHAQGESLEGKSEPASGRYQGKGSAAQHREVVEGESLAEGGAEQVFKLPLSKSLARKVRQKAADEGVTPEELLCELVAEGLVLRAWEIMERKSTMRGGRPQSFSQKGGNRYREQKGRRGFNNRGSRAEKGTALLEDRAAFLEYVRSQEKGNK